MRACGVTWSKQRSLSTSIEPARQQQGGRSPPGPALDPRLLHPRVEPVLRRRLRTERRASGDPRRATERALPTCSGWSTLICCRYRRCCCSVARSAIISAAGGCSSSARACSRSHRWSARSRRAFRSCSPHARAQGIGAALLLPNSLALAQRRLFGRKARPRRRHLGRRGRGAGGDRAADRRLAGRHRRLAGDLLHQPAARARRDPARAQASSRKVAKRGAGRTDYAGALLATAGLGGLTYAPDLVVGARAMPTAIALGSVALGIVLLVGFPVGRTPPRRPRDDATRAVRRPLLLRPEPPHLPSLRRVRSSDAAHPLRADHAAAAIRRCRRAWRCFRCRS